MYRVMRIPLLVILILVLAVSALAKEPIFLWQILGENAAVHLTGSIHVGKKDFYPLPDDIERAFAASDVLAVEVDISRPEVMQTASEIMMTRGMLPEDATLQSSVAPELYARLTKFAAERGIPLEMYGKMRPSLVAMMLVMAEYQRLGYEEGLGVDQHFLTAAKTAGKEVRQLESIEAQMALFLDMSDELDDVLLEAVLDQTADLEAMTDAMVKTWKNGDAEGLSDMLQEQKGDDPRMEEFYHKLLDERNEAIVATIDSWLHGDENVFVVVGAGHYGGDMGMLKLLRQRGWTVTQVTQ